MIRVRAGLVAVLVALPLGGCPTVDLGDTPTDIGLCNPPGGIEYFETEIWPRFVRPADPAKGCTRTGGCHNEAGGNALGFKTNAAAPLMLSAQDYAFNYRQAQVFLNCGTPEASQLLTKPLAGQDPHGGSDIFTSTADDPVVAFLAWFM